VYGGERPGHLHAVDLVMLAKFIAPQRSEWVLDLAPSPIPGIPAVVVSRPAHVNRAGLRHILAPQTATQNMAVIQALMPGGVVTLFASECFCWYLPPGSPPGDALPYGGGSIGVIGPGGTITNTRTGIPGLAGLPAGYTGGWPGYGYGFWYGGLWWEPIWLGYYGAWGWAAMGYWTAGATGISPAAGGTAGVPLVGPGPKPPASQQANVSDIEIHDQAQATIIPPHTVPALDTAAVQDRARLAVRWIVLGQDGLVVTDQPPPVQTPRFQVPVPVDALAIGDVGHLAIGIRPVGASSLTLGNRLPLASPVVLTAQDAVGVGTVGQWFSGPNLCYGPISVYDRARVQLQGVWRSLETAALVDTGRAYPAGPPAGIETLGAIDRGAVVGGTRAQDAIPQVAGIGDQAAVRIHPRVALTGADTAGIGDTGQATAGIPQGAWTAIASDLVTRDQFAAAYDSGANLTYAIDGYNGGFLSTLTGYSHASNAWTALASDLYARSGLAAAYDSGANLTYAIDADSAYNNNAVTGYSHASNTWTTLASVAIGSANLGAFFPAAVYDSGAGLTYIMDGNTGSTAADSVNRCLAYSHASNAWTYIAFDLVAREQLAAAYDSGANLTYAIDGTGTAGTAIATVTAYSHASNAWTALASDLVARFGLGACYDRHAALTYAIDGASSQFLSTLTGYSHASNAWTALASDLVVRDFLAVVYDQTADLSYAIDGGAPGNAILATVTAYAH
jgi:hypothetical protein